MYTYLLLSLLCKDYIYIHSFPLMMLQLPIFSFMIVQKLYAFRGTKKLSLVVLCITKFSWVANILMSPSSMKKITYYPKSPLTSMILEKDTELMVREFQPYTMLCYLRLRVS